MAQVAAQTRPGRIRICAVSELGPGERTVVEVDGPAGSIGVFSTPDGYVAVRNYCPHQGAPICLGRWGATTNADRPYEYEYELEGRVLACPWHQWEFDLKNGRALFDDSVRLRRYPVVVEDGAIFVDLKGRVNEPEKEQDRD
jgi:nitrite reductase (NADH) small subunit